MSRPQTVSAIFSATISVAGNTWVLSCNDNVFDNLSGALAGTAAWTFPGKHGYAKRWRYHPAERDLPWQRHGHDQ
jgi:hypothetical protein